MTLKMLSGGLLAVFTPALSGAGTLGSKAVLGYEEEQQMFASQRRRDHGRPWVRQLQ